MAPQNLNMDLLLTAKEGSPILRGDIELLKRDIPKAKSRRYSNEKKGVRKERFQLLKPVTIDPFQMIQSLLKPGMSAASCNEETLSSSFLILDGTLTISLGALSYDKKESNYDMLEDATERWGSRLETNICVGKVCYEYRYDNEEAEEKCRSNSFSDAEEDIPPNHGAVLSQTLDLVPLVLDDTLNQDSMTISPGRYVPPSHKMVADCLKFKEYDEAAKVYFDILKADQNRYGDNDLVCAIDYHNLGVTNLLAGDLNASLHYFQESVFLKRECLGENDINVADSLVEIGIILYSKDDLSGAESFFNEAIDIFLNNHEESSSCSDSIGRVYNNIACVYYKKNDLKSAYNYIQKSLVAQKNTLGLNSKAESALLNYALTQANTGFLKCKLNHLDALAPLEDSLLVLESVLGDDNTTITNVRNNIAFAKRL